MKSTALSLASITLLVLFALSPAARVTADEFLPPAGETLHIRKLADGRWIGWCDIRNQRIRINVPQSREGIFTFAREYQLQVELHGETPERRSLPKEPNVLPAAADEPRIPAVTERAGDPRREIPSPTLASPANPAPMPTAATSPVLQTEAEQVTKLEAAIATSEQRISELKSLLSNPDGEFQKAQAEFKEIGTRLEEEKVELERLRNLGDGTDTTAAEAEVNALEKKWRLARERFNLAIITQKTQQEQIAALQAKIHKDRQALENLLSPNMPPTGEPPFTSDSTATPPAAPPTAAAPATVAPKPNLPATTPPATPAPPADAAPKTTPAEKTAAEPPAAPDHPANPKLIQAQHQAEIKKEAARAAERDAQTVSERLAAVNKNIDLEQKLYDAARKKSDIAFEQRKTLQEEFHAKSIDGTPVDELQRLSRNLSEADKLFHQTRQEVATHMDRLHELQNERTELQAKELAALNTAQQKSSEAKQAVGEVNELQNPYSLHNLSQWLLDHGLKISLILVAMFALRGLVKLGNQRIVALMIHAGHGSREEREDRASTLMGVFHNAATVAVTIGGSLMIFEEVGVPVATLMGSAAILGLAVAFGAQNLIRDYFYGFVILLENQYKINDVLKIGEISGQVERITLRMTVLRDLEGRVHFIPNGKIDSVTNMTHGWSRAVFEIRVGYREDVDRVMGVLMELARDMKRDPKYAMLIIDEPEMLGVDAFSDSAVIIKFVMKTRPLRQWAIKREMLRRIKRTFDELGIEIPYPHRTINHADNPAANTPTLAPSEEDTPTQQAA